MAVETVQILEGSGPTIVPPAFSVAEYERRVEGVRKVMRERGLAAFVSFTPENLNYITGHDTPGYYFYQACVITHDRKPINVLRKVETTNTLGRGWSRLAVGVLDREDPVEKTLGLLHELGVAGQKIGAEGNSWFVSPERWLQLQAGIEKAGGSLENASSTIENLRMIKSAEELVYIRQAARACERGMAAAVGATREGTDENEVAAVAVAELIRAGAEYAGLPPFITSGPRTSLAHSTWEGRVYQKGDVVNYELPGVVKRYTAALYRCGVIGKPDDDMARKAEMVQEVLATVIDHIKPGATSHEVHASSIRVFEKYGLGHLVDHRTGYSVGVNYAPDWGEGHIISIWDGDQRQLQPGMTFHLVPGFYDLGKYTIIISETVLVTDSGCEVVTNFPRDFFVA